jgi:subtilisin family serine protease
MRRSIRAIAYSSGLATLFATVGTAAFGQGIPAPQVEFLEVADELEFSGRLIARPVQMADWLEAGLSRRAAQSRIDDAIAALGQFAIDRYVPQTDESIILVPGGRTENDVANELLATGLFQYVEPDWIVYPVGCPNDSLFGNQWQHAATIMQSCDGWDIHTGNPTTSVGICDTGLRVTHEDFQLHRLEGYNAVDFLWESQGGNITDINGHGTATTGCAAANGNNGIGVAGVGWNLSHRILKVSNISSGSSSISTLTHAARTAVENGDSVASVSYSGVNNATVRETATYIKSIGGLMVWAAGNSNANLADNDRDADDVIVVGATDSGDNKASFSNYGIYVDLCAPGVSVYTTSNAGNSSYGGASGTSFSCPLTAGLVALIWSANPDLTPDEVELILKQGCEDIGAGGIDNIHGYGRINVYNSLLLVEAALEFNYPNGLPSLINPSGGTTVRVEVLAGGETPQPGTGVLHVNDGSGWNAFPMDEVTDNIYDGEFPAVQCGNTVLYYFTAESTDGNIISDPSGAPTASVYDAPAASGISVVFADDFQTDKGWTVSNENLTDGAWQRGVPAGDGTRGDPTDDFDNSGSCFLTDNVAGNSDVDGGPTRLISPVFDMSGGGEATISFARWFFNDDGDEDRLVVEVSNNGGTSWTVVESVADSNSGGWNEHSFRVADFVAPTATMRLRFSATDNPNDSVTEAALDAVAASIVSCGGSVTLTNVRVNSGTLISGNLASILDSDNVNYQVRSAVVGTRNIAQIRVVGDAAQTGAATIDVMYEGRISQAGGTAQWRLRNWNTNGLELVHSHPIGATEGLFTKTGIPAATYIRGDGIIHLVIRHYTIVNFDPDGFDSFTDHVRMTTN